MKFYTSNTLSNIDLLETMNDDFFEDIEIEAIDKILKYNTSELHDESNNTTRVTIDDRSTIDTS